MCVCVNLELEEKNFFFLKIFLECLFEQIFTILVRLDKFWSKLFRILVVVLRGRVIGGERDLHMCIHIHLYTFIYFHFVNTFTSYSFYLQVKS